MGSKIMLFFKKVKGSTTISKKLHIIFILLFTLLSGSVWSMEKEEEGLLVYPCSSPFDTRKKVRNTEDPFYRIHGHLDITYEGEREGIGSGVLVGPRHVLTVAHNIICEEKNEEEEVIGIKKASRIIFTPGRNGKKKPYGSYEMIDKFYHPKWKKQWNHDYDLAIIVLDRPINPNIGWAGMYVANDKEMENLQVRMTGYPGDKKDGKTMWTSKESIELKHIRDNKIFLNNFYTYNGQSGSAVWIKKGGPYVVGVHSHKGERQKDDTIDNVSIRITEEKLEMIKQWIEQPNTKLGKGKRKKSRKNT